MKRNFYLSGIVAGVALLALMHIVRAQGPGPQSATAAQAAVLGTGFTYQGQLARSGLPVSGACDFRFSLWDAAGSGSPPAGGTQIGGTQIVTDTNVTGGLFTVRLDFGSSAFTGDARYLQVAVRCPAGDGSYATLAPRQSLTAVPYALSLWPGATISGTNGLTVQSHGNGVDVSSSNGDGVHVESAQTHGVRVDSADIGLSVYSALEDGVSIGSTGWDGVSVSTAGSDGVSVSTAAFNGVSVWSAGADGVRVQSAGEDGIHVSAAGGDGVDATTTSTLAYGGHFLNSAADGVGLYARGGDGDAADIVLGANGSSESNNDGYLASDPSFDSDLVLIGYDQVDIHLDQDNDQSSLFRVLEGGNFPVFWVDELGNTDALGTKSAVVTTPSYGQRKLYAVESPEVWFEDFGTAQLTDGLATVMIEPVFAQTVNLSEYHVFLTPLGDCPLYVAEKTPAAFTVKAMGGQACRITFDYRIVARRLGYESVRLETATSAEAGGEE
jgi:hypothetical protein